MPTKRIAFFNANYLITFFHELMLEKVQEHLDLGDEVTVFSCNKELPTCDMNFHHTLTECNVCVSKQKKGRSLLSKLKKIDSINTLSIDLTPDEKIIVKSFVIKDDLSNQEIRDLKYENFELGWGVLSSLSNLYREPEPDFEPIIDVLHKLIRTALGIYLYAKRILKEKKIDQVYILNGRYAYERAFVAACQINNVQFYCFERGAKFDKIRLTKNAGIHSILEFSKSVENVWNNANPDKRMDIAFEYFANRMAISKTEEIKGFESNNIGFYTQNQEKDKLPENFDTSKTNIAIFNSSEDEFRALDISWKMDLYSSQNEATQILFDDFKNRTDFNLYLRVHPNLSNLETSNVKEIYNLNTYSNSSIIPADSEISTYALIKACDLIIVFGSSVGVEATFLQKPALLLGKSNYLNMDMCYVPKNHQEVRDYINNIPEPKPQIEALKMGYFLLNYGEDTKYFEAQDILHCTFKGHNIHHLNLFGKIWRRGWQLPGFKHLLKPIEKAHSDKMYKKILQ